MGNLFAGDVDHEMKLLVHNKESHLMHYQGLLELPVTLLHELHDDSED